jgi:hypothetical protein
VRAASYPATAAGEARRSLRIGRPACRSAGGGIDLVSEPGRGTCIRCTFPVADAHGAQRDTASA